MTVHVLCFKDTIDCLSQLLQISNDLASENTSDF